MTAKNSDKKLHLLDQQVAMHAYLDDLLQEVPDAEESRSAPVSEPDAGSNPGSRDNAGLKSNSSSRIKHGLVRKQEKQVQQQPVQTQERQPQDIYPVSNPEPEPGPESKQELRQELQYAPRPVVDIPVLRELQQVEVPVHVPETKGEIETDSKVQVDSKQQEKSGNEHGIPDWAQERFKCLLFKVAGISLAVPLVKLNGVVSWSEKITPMPGHSKTFLGVLRHREQNVKVVDTAQIVLPEKQHEGLLSPPEQRLKNVILVDNCNWGLACDEIGEVIILEPDEVRWRTPKGKIKWLAGTVLQHLCALLEVDTFTRLLSEDNDLSGD